jgi:RHH-type proline utilization regulon transcriptional repressor/proline dehydrogenase/delta 1-pyrroline-5-carboxylate dehydrogenase
MENKTHFANLPLLDFAIEEYRSNMKVAIDALIKDLQSGPKEILPIYPGLKKGDGQTRVNLVPENLNLKISSTSEASKEQFDSVVPKLLSAFEEWSRTDIELRASLLEKVADLMVKKRYQLCAVIILETGKGWVEADADLGEAVDFLRYYAIEARELFKSKKMGNLQGENNIYFYEPRGLSAVICPWNFPLAIPCGMFAASIVCGNSTILKPAEQSPLIAREMFNLFLEAGLPENVACFLPGDGENVGVAISKSKEISTIVFTGSKAVGLKLIQDGGVTHEGQKHVKRVIAEMGGKNAIVIDNDADIDEAVKGVLYSSFGFSGQKCSACSKVYIVDKAVYENFKSRLSDAVSSIKVGPASDPGSYLGPVIDKEAYDRISNTVSEGKKRLSVVSEATLDSSLEGKGYFIKPIIFENASDNDPIIKHEIFGPVVHIQAVSSFEEGIKKAIDSEYRLTGAIFSRSPKNIDYAIKEFKVGNLYINRGSTGALVYRQPFGGAHMSGVGSKAGGPDYLQQFVVPRVVSENTMRRGFAPS